MGSYFIYDSINMYRSDMTDSEGQMSNSDTPTFSTGTTVTNHERSSDQSIGTAISGLADLDAIEYAVGSSATANAAAVYFNADDGISSGTIMNFFADTSRNSGGSGLTNKGTISAVSSAGWAVTDLTETTGTKFFVEFTGSITDNVITEILIGKKLSFEVEPDVNVKTQRDFGNVVSKSLGGVEYALNTHDAQEISTISFQNISSTFKTNLLSMQDDIKGEAKKFLWYDGSSFHWVRLDKPLTFTEIADGRFSTQIVLRQQIQ